MNGNDSTKSLIIEMKAVDPSWRHQSTVQTPVEHVIAAAVVAKVISLRGDNPRYTALAGHTMISCQIQLKENYRATTCGVSSFYVVSRIRVNISVLSPKLPRWEKLASQAFCQKAHRMFFKKTHRTFCQSCIIVTDLMRAARPSG